MANDTVQHKFTVDALELQATARQAFNLSNELADSSLPRHALDQIGGAANVEGEYDAFLQHWSDGLLRVSNALSELANRLGAAADSYLQADQAIERAASAQRHGGERT